MRLKSITILGIAANSIKYNHCDLTTNSEIGDNFLSKSCKSVSISDPSAWILIDSGSGYTKVTGFGSFDSELINILEWQGSPINPRCIPPDGNSQQH
ncbi:hypothetical protein HUJ05_003974 [Dendroctonus ponderosae]|nr:hypothetical protein HUJ05_003974 [Dendroctonus ponderosae]